MSPENAIATVCEYCGRKNEERLPHCAGCGTPLADELSEDDSQPKKKSKFLAAFLAGIFGPLGVCYVNVDKGIYLWLGMLVVGILCLIGHVHIGFALLLSRIISVSRALTLLHEQEIALDPMETRRFSLIGRRVWKVWIKLKLLRLTKKLFNNFQIPKPAMKLQKILQY